LDDYETAAFQKVCKIHRKLPPGGILVFLTGKQEIVRMVNRLKSSLIPKFDRKTDDNNEQDVQVDEIQDEYVDSSLRDMDDDEADGDLFQNDEDNDDYEDMDETDGQQPIFDQDDNIPKKVKILPLYSLLSVQDQAKVFAPLDENTRLIVVTTNIAETSLTIPGISYVVDTGRQKCRNYHAGTGVASYDVMWISKASADQRAGRAGRTGPGHCYRTYSSSVYSRHLDAFALPEVLSRPLEDVVLAMKSMNISNVGNFPFPTPPDKSQLDAAVKLLANIGCIDVSNIEREGGDGVITKLGAAIAKLPIGVRYGKMLLVAAQGNVLDYGIVMVSVLSEASPFAYRKENEAGNDESSNESDNDSEDMDEVDKNNALRQERQKRKENSNLWRHDGGDILAKVLASGAYAYAGRGSGGASESFACKRFCEENALNPVIMQRIHKMRLHLAKLAKQRLGRAEGIAASTGKILSTMSPPTKAQENLLKQAISSGLLDNVARRSPQSRLQTGGAQVSRSAYFSCRSAIQEPLYIDRKSVLYSRDPRQLPEWICYDTLIRKQTKDGSTISTMTNVTPIDPQWLGSLAMGCKILVIGDPLDVPVPSYDPYRDKIMCSVTTKYGDQGWILPPIQMNMDEISGKGSKHVMADDAYRWFARYLLEGKVFDKLKNLRVMLNEDPSIITRKKPSSKVAMLVSALSQNNISSAKALIRYWATKDKTFLFKNLKSWVKKENAEDAKTLWINFVKEKLVESNNL
jgi:ATP-dependent RNA helicase DHX37/DHR1